MTSKTIETFGQRLSRLRQAAGLTKYALFKQTGIAQAYLGDLERDEKRPSADVLAKLTAGLGQKSLAVWDDCFARQ